MDKNGLGFFDTPESSECSNEKRIFQLRKRADSYQKEHNKAIDRIWEIELELTKPLSSDEKVQLTDELNELNLKVDLMKRPEKIVQLKQEIKELENRSGISSSLTRGSPFQFNPTDNY